MKIALKPTHRLPTFMALLTCLLTLMGSGIGIFFQLPGDAASGQANLQATQPVVFINVSPESQISGISSQSSNTTVIQDEGTTFLAFVDGGHRPNALNLSLRNDTAESQTVTIALEASSGALLKVELVNPIDDVLLITPVGSQEYVITVKSTGQNPNNNPDIKVSRATPGYIGGRILMGVHAGAPADRKDLSDTAALVHNLQVATKKKAGAPMAADQSGPAGAMSNTSSSGDVRNVRNLGSIGPPEGDFMGLLSTSARLGAEDRSPGVSGRDISVLKLRLPPMPDDAAVMVSSKVNILTNENAAVPEADFFRIVLMGFFEAGDTTPKSLVGVPVPVVSLMEVNLRGPDLILPPGTDIRIEGPLVMEKTPDGNFRVNQPRRPLQTFNDLPFVAAPGDTGFKLQTGFRHIAVTVSGLGGLTANLSKLGGAESAPFASFELWLVVGEGRH